MIEVNCLGIHTLVFITYKSYVITRLLKAKIGRIRALKENLSLQLLNLWVQKKKAFFLDGLCCHTHGHVWNHRAINPNVVLWLSNLQGGSLEFIRGSRHEQEWFILWRVLVRGFRCSETGLDCSNKLTD